MTAVLGQGLHVLAGGRGPGGSSLPVIGRCSQPRGAAGKLSLLLSLFSGSCSGRWKEALLTIVLGAPKLIDLKSCCQPWVNAAWQPSKGEASHTQHKPSSAASFEGNLGQAQETGVNRWEAPRCRCGAWSSGRTPGSWLQRQIVRSCPSSTDLPFKGTSW